MHQLLRVGTGVSAVILIAGITWPSHAMAAQTQEVENLKAFTKLYGYVRWFHPSDEAAAADWWQVAKDGTSAVRGAANSEELEYQLNDVFLPLAPSLPPRTGGRRKFARSTNSSCNSPLNTLNFS